MSASASGNACRHPPSKQHGYSLLEFFIASVIISLVAVFLLERLLTYQEYAEQAAMELTVTNMRSGLRLQVADLMTQDRMNEMGALVKQNPVHWLETSPPNYLGELAPPVPKTLAQGNWYFDTTQRELVYLPHNSRLTPWREQKEAMRFQVISVRQALGKDGAPGPGIEWVTLAQTNK